MTAEDEVQLWAHWHEGASINGIGRIIGISGASVHGYLSKYGGFRPPERTRRASHLTDVEREEISRGVAAGRSVRAIAADLERAPSTISRELLRNGGRASYRANLAEERA